VNSTPQNLLFVAKIRYSSSYIYAIGEFRKSLDCKTIILDMSIFRPFFGLQANFGPKMPAIHRNQPPHSHPILRHDSQPIPITSGSLRLQFA
jgi:hypothetical protein